MFVTCCRVMRIRITSAAIQTCKSATGAEVWVMDDDVDVVRTGGRSDFQYPAQELYPPGPVDRVCMTVSTFDSASWTWRR